MNISKSLLHCCPLFSMQQRWYVKTLMMLDDALQTMLIFASIKIHLSLKNMV